MQQLNDKQRATLLLSLGIKNAKGLNIYRPKTKSTRNTTPPPHSTKAKPVRCINTGVVYPSVNAAARANNIRAGNLCWHLKGRHLAVAGLRFEYV